MHVDRHLRQVQATLFVPGNGEGVLGAGLGIQLQAFTQACHPACDRFFVLQLLRCQGAVVDHLLQHHGRVGTGQAINHCHNGLVVLHHGFQGGILDGRCLRVHVQLGAFQGGLGQVGFLRLFILQVLFLLAALDLVQGRHGNEHVATIDDFTHLPEQEGQQQGTNVRAVYVGVRHDNDGVVTQFVRVEFFPPDTATEGGNQCAHFGRRQHLVETGFLYVQDLTLQGQDGLGFPVTTLLGTTTRRITLHDEQFRQGRVFFLAVSQLAGQAGDIQRTLAAGHIPGFTGGFTGTGRFDHLVDDHLGFVRFFLQVIGKLLVQLLLNRGFHLG